MQHVLALTESYLLVAACLQERSIFGNLLFSLGTRVPSSSKATSSFSSHV
jgi:hypothetical protein